MMCTMQLILDKQLTIKLKGKIVRLFLTSKVSEWWFELENLIISKKKYYPFFFKSLLHISNCLL